MKFLCRQLKLIQNKMCFIIQFNKMSSDQIMGVSQIEVNELDEHKIRFGVRLEIQGHPPSPESCVNYLQNYIPNANVINVTYRCDVCYSGFETSDTLINQQCDQCGHYYDICQSCQQKGNYPVGCYICQK